MAGTGPIEVKTTLGEAQYNTMLKFCEALGMTQAGFVRQAILEDMARKHALVDQLSEIVESPKPDRNSA